VKGMGLNMDNIDFTVKISPDEAANIVEREIVNGSISAELVDKYLVSGNDGDCIVLVFEKYYMRTSSRASLAVTLSNLKGITNVHAVGSGGGQGAIFSFDWGASSDFAYAVENALNQYK
jgi:hypothetical protein